MSTLRVPAILWVTIFGFAIALADVQTPTQQTPSAQPPPASASTQTAAASSYPVQPYASQQQATQDAVQQYVQQYQNPMAPYGYNDPSYVQSGYEGYLTQYPAMQTGHQNPSYDFQNNIVPALRNGLQTGLRILGRAALFVLGAAGIVFFGGLITTAICTFTPLCTITFAGYGVTKEAMRSLVTPDRVSAAASFVQDALDKYQRLQHAAM